MSRTAPVAPNTSSHTHDVEDPIPLVIVEGFLSAGGPLLWGNFEEHSNPKITLDSESPRRRVIFASVGPVSSLHDRACELYYVLMGGKVDYGEDHARRNGHKRFGRTHENGLYPRWSRHHPLHFLGHSMGGPTIIKMQWLLATGFFGEASHPDMLLSVTTVSAPFRGSQIVYSLGEEVDNAPAVRPYSAGAFVAKGVHVLSYLSPLLPFLDLHVESRSLAYNVTSFSAFLKQLGRSEWAESSDSAPFDVTFQASDGREANKEGLPNDGTFYMSYAASMTVAESDGAHFRPSLGHAVFMPVLSLLSLFIGWFDLSSIHPSPSIVDEATKPQQAATSHNSAVLRSNDGVVPLFSQWHPFSCNSTCCKHRTWIEDDDASDAKQQENLPSLTPGLWNVYHVRDANHVSIAPFWFGTRRQRLFWERMGNWLQSIEAESSSDAKKV
ncbi:hypothetical protein BC835DRAFT_44185 [Cytidiella melzeri]|nr:hypothetical protein BC835DRAFT_44185 [Cytidiella melzeri]